MGKSSLNKEVVKEFLKLVKTELGLTKLPKIVLSKDPKEATQMRSWGGYNPKIDGIHIVIANRHPMDVFRTLAHELVHYKQDIEGGLDSKSGETGSEDENEANAQAAIIMRKFADQKPELFEHLRLQ